MIVGGAKPLSSVSTCAPTAWPDSFSPAIASLTTLRGARPGPSHQTGSGAIIAATWLPSAPRSIVARAR